MEIPSDWLDTIIRLVSATLLSGIVGLEREVRNKPAGLRTHMLVGLGAAACCVFSLDVMERLQQVNELARFDPIRIIEGVIGGLGFLGAGAIIQSRGNVHGLTSAAGIWIAGAIGVGCGMGSFFAAVVLTLIVVICLVPVRWLEREINRTVEHNRNTDTD